MTTQNDLVIANADGATLRADVNSALQAMAALQEGSSAVGTTYPFQLWADTGTNLLKQRNAANSAWIVRATLAETLVLTKTGAYTVGVADRGVLIKADAASAAFTISLPAAATAGAGFWIPIKRINATVNDGSKNVTIDGDGSETIDGATTYVLKHKNQGVVLYCDGSAWHVIGEVAAGHGWQTVFLPAASLRPTQSNGAGALVEIETTAGRPDIQGYPFDASADEHVQGLVAFPPSWDKGPVQARFFHTHQGGQTGGSDGVAWFGQGVAMADDDTFDVAYGTPVAATAKDGATAEDVYVGAWTGDITIAGSPGDNELVALRFGRDVSDAGDDLDIDAILVAVSLRYRVTAGNDN